MGSDYYPIFVEVGTRMEINEINRSGGWVFDKADWVKFREVCEVIMGEININQETEKLNQCISGAIIEAAVQSGTLYA